MWTSEFSAASLSPSPSCTHNGHLQGILIYSSPSATPEVVHGTPPHKASTTPEVAEGTPPHKAGLAQRVEEFLTVQRVQAHWLEGSQTRSNSGSPGSEAHWTGQQGSLKDWPDEGGPLFL